MKAAFPLSMQIALGVIVLGVVAFFFLPSVVGVAYPLSRADHISSWSWQGSYKDGGEKEAAANTEIGHLKNMVGNGGASTYDLYIGIASEYELLGDGKNAYRYLSKAIATDKTRGLAYMNMGHLMEELGAFETARAAYASAVAAEPNTELYHTAQEGFLARHP